MIETTAITNKENRMIETTAITRITTGIPRLDQELSGGLAPKEIGMVITGSKVNTIFPLIGQINAGAKAGFQVLFITIATALDEINATTSKITCIDNSDSACSTVDIERQIIAWKEKTRAEYGEEEAAKCKLVCIDRLDKIAFDGDDNIKPYAKLATIAEYLGFIARRTDTVIWTTTTCTSKADGKAVLTLTDIPGAYSAASAFDTIIGMGRGPEDEDDELVISLIKSRESSNAGSLSFKL